MMLLYIIHADLHVRIISRALLFFDKSYQKVYKTKKSCITKAAFLTRQSFHANPRENKNLAT